MKIKWIFILSIIFCSSFFVGIWRAGQSLEKVGDSVLDNFVDEKVKLIGQIVEGPDKRQTVTKLTVRVDKLISFDSDIEQLITVNAKILVSVEPFRNFKYGNTVSISGKLRIPENFETDTGRVFDYKNYLGKDKIYYQMSFVDVEVLEAEGGNFIKRWMLSLKDIFVERIEQFFPQPEGALLAGVLFGEQAGMGDTLQDYFRRTGIIHIVVLSGFNVTIVAIFIVWILGRFLSPRIALLFGVLGIILFALLVGAGATIIRASIMAILAIVARLLGRTYQVIRGLFIAAFFMVFQNPKILLFDISFQLSFLATLSLIYFSPIIERYFTFITEKFALRETIVATFAAQVFVLPLLLYSIGEFSIVSPIVNILVVPWVSITMLLGFISAFLGIIWSGFGIIIMIPTYIILHAQILIVKFFGELSFASIIVPQFSVWIMAAIYMMLFYGMYGLSQKKDN